MKRRKFVVGLGSLATGAAAAMGTGAFSQVRATRGARPTFVGDAEAYLALGACDGPNGDQYVESNKQGRTRVNFDELTAVNGQGIDPNDGKGLNRSAVTIINEVLEIQNRGTQPVEVDLSDPDPSDDLTVRQPDSINAGSTFGSEGVYVALASDAAELGLGESVCLDFAVKAGKNGLPTGTRTFAIKATGDV